MFTVTQRVHLIHIHKNIYSWFIRKTEENRLSLWRYYKWFALLKRIEKFRGQNTLFYLHKIWKYGCFIVISYAYVKQKMKCLRTVHFNISNQILQLIGQLRKLQCIRRRNCIVLVAKIH